MAEPMQAARGFEPQPIPDDLPANAPILHDIERGYSASAEAGAYDDDGVPEAGPSVERQRKESQASALSQGSNGQEKVKKKQRGAGLTEGDADVDDIPKNNLAVVMPAVGLVLFLSALDQTIVATALPTIAEDLNASPSEYSWVGSSYLLSMTLLAPVNGRVSDIIGRKPMLYAAILDFTIFSALCGAAKNITWLIVCRAFQGLGGGSIIGLTTIVVSDIVPLHKRGTYQGWLGLSWSVASVLGPILGGVLTEKASWRWCFYINLPTCGIAFVLLLLTLKLNPTRKLTLDKFLRTFDFIGMALTMLGAALLSVGFSLAADAGFSAKSAWVSILVGALLFLGAIVNFLTTKRTAVIPARMFKNRTTLFFLIGSLLHATAFIPSNWIIPEMLQGVRGVGAIGSGVQLLPFSCVVATCTVVAGQINSRLRIIRPVVWTGYGVAALGFGLFYHFFSYPIPFATQEGLFVVAALGTGLSLQVPMLVLQAAMPLKDMAATTAAWTLTRSIGGTVGLAVFTAVLNTGLRSRFEKIPGYGTEFTVPQSASDYQKLHDLPDGELKDRVLGAFADSFKLCWIIECALFAGALAITLWTRSYSLNRTRGQPKIPADADTDTPDNVDQQGPISSGSSETAVAGEEKVSGGADDGEPMSGGTAGRTKV